MREETQQVRVLQSYTRPQSSLHVLRALQKQHAEGAVCVAAPALHLNQQEPMPVKDIERKSVQSSALSAPSQPPPLCRVTEKLRPRHREAHQGLQTVVLGNGSASTAHGTTRATTSTPAGKSAAETSAQSPVAELASLVAEAKAIGRGDVPVSKAWVAATPPAGPTQRSKSLHTAASTPSTDPRPEQTSAHRNQGAVAYQADHGLEPLPLVDPSALLSRRLGDRGHQAP